MGLDRLRGGGHAFPLGGGSDRDPTRHYSCFDGLSSPQRAAGPFPDPAWLYPTLAPLALAAARMGRGSLALSPHFQKNLAPASVGAFCLAASVK